MPEDIWKNAYPVDPYNPPEQREETSWEQVNKKTEIPYRGQEQHGVPSPARTADYSPTPDGGVIEDDDQRPRSDIEPLPVIDVRIVEGPTPLIVSRRVAVNKFVLPAEVGGVVTPVLIAPQDHSRTRLVLFSGEADITIGPKQDELGYLGFELPLEHFEIFTTEPLYATSTGVERSIHVLSEYVVNSGGKIR